MDHMAIIAAEKIPELRHYRLHYRLQHSFTFVLNDSHYCGAQKSLGILLAACCHGRLNKSQLKSRSDFSLLADSSRFQ